MPSEGLRPDRERCSPTPRLGEEVLHGAAHGDNVGERGLDTEAPELRDVLLAGAARVVGRERHALTAFPKGGDRLHGARGRLLSDPDAPVEVEYELVVALGEEGQAHVWQS